MRQSLVRTSEGLRLRGRSWNDDTREEEARLAERLSAPALPHSLRRHALGALLQPDRARARRHSLLLLVSAWLDPPRRRGRPPRPRDRHPHHACDGKLPQEVGGDGCPGRHLVTHEPTATIIFVALFLFVTWLGFVAARWRKPDLNLLHEWGLGGRRLGTMVTWFLLGGGLSTPYPLIPP